MKSASLSLIFTFLVSSFYAQDTIIKRSGDTIIAKILEINPIEVKYKKAIFLDGPTYVEQKSFIKMISYQGGRKEFFEQAPEKPKLIAPPSSDNLDYYGDNSNGTNKMGMWSNGRFRQKNTRLTEKQAQDIFIQTKELKLMELAIKSRNARKMQYIGFAAIPLGILGLGVINTYSNANSVASYAGGMLCIAGAIACPIVSGQYKKKRTAYNTAAVKLYNQRF